MVIHNAILTGSISMQAPPVISGSLTLTGSINATGDITASSARFSNIITAQTLVVQTVSSSVTYISGSTQFGSSSINTHQFTGSLLVTGSETVTGNLQVGGVGKTSGWYQLNLADYNTNGAATGSGVQIQLASAGTNFGIGFTGSLLSVGLTSNGTNITSPYLNINQSGKVGISNTNPSYALTVQADANDMISWRTPSYEVGRLGIDNTNAYGWIALFASGSQNTQISGRTGGYTYFNSGNVGIGRNTDNSLGKLQVTGAPLWMDFGTYAYFNSRYNNTSNYGNILFSNGTGQNLWFGETASNIYTFGNGSAGVAISNTVLSMNMSSNTVSVGSTSSAYNFNVYAASGADGWGAFFGGAGTTKGGIYLGNAGTQYGSLYFDNANNNVYLKQSYASGNVSVIANTGGVYLANGGTSWAAISSDERKKKNFETVPGLNTILQVEPVKYHFLTDEDTATKRLGFKAQNIQPLIPEMVLETGEIAEDGSPYLTVTPDYILPVLVKAIQELKAEIDELKNK